MNRQIMNLVVPHIFENEMPRKNFGDPLPRISVVYSYMIFQINNYKFTGFSQISK